MTQEEAIEQIQKLQGSGDTEILHSLADKVLCDFLISLGYKNIVDEWEKVNKWYA